MDKVEKENIKVEEEKEAKAEAQKRKEADSEANKENSAAESEAESANVDGLQIELSREELVEELKEKEKRIENLDAEIDDLLSRLQRLQADFVNYRKRSQREKAEMTTQGKIELSLDLLPVIDNFERALKSEDNRNDFYEGVEMIYNQLLKSLKDQGIEEIVAEDKEFDPEYHKAIMKVETDDYKEGMIVDVVQKGFILEDRVIRPAMVRVAG